MDFATALLCAGAAIAITYWSLFSWNRGGNWSRSLTKTASTVALALAGLAMGAHWLVVAGLIFGAAGDFCLSRPGSKTFLAGMAAFALGHLAYALLFLDQADFTLLIASPRAVAVAVLLALLVSTEVWLAPYTGKLRDPVRGYVLVITVMGIAALAVPHAGPAFGAALFLLSDLLLALRLFRFPTGRMRCFLALVLWPFYWIGQFSILLASLALSNSL